MRPHTEGCVINKDYDRFVQTSLLINGEEGAKGDSLAFGKVPRRRGLCGVEGTAGIQATPGPRRSHSDPSVPQPVPPHRVVSGTCSPGLNSPLPQAAATLGRGGLKGCVGTSRARLSLSPPSSLPAAPPLPSGEDFQEPGSLIPGLGRSCRRCSAGGGLWEGKKPVPNP